MSPSFCRVVLLGLLFPIAGQASAQAINARDSRLMVLGSSDLPSTPGATGSRVDALAAGDFNCDGVDDLAVGDPTATVSGQVAAGAITVRYGDVLRGLDGPTQVISQNTPNVTGAAQTTANFGAALATYVKREAPCRDLAVGAPGYDAANQTDSGFVVLLRGAPNGLTIGRTSIGLPRDDLGAPAGHTANHRKGKALATTRHEVYAFNPFVTDPSLVIGAPGHVSGFAIGAGGVNVHETGPGGTLDSTIFVQRNEWPNEFGRNLDNFGTVVAGGDFNGDGFGDVVVQARHVDGCLTPCPFPEPQTGALFVEYGGFMVNPIREKLSQATPGIAGTPENGDRFGAALAVGNFDSDTLDDLAIGIPGETSGSDTGAGMVTVLFGHPDGLVAGAASSQTFTQAALPGVTRAAGDEFGAALAAARISGANLADDLVIGSPGDSEAGAIESGIIHVVPAGPGRTFNFAGTSHFSLASPGIPGTPRSLDRLGSAIAVGDFNNDGPEDIAVAIPRVSSTQFGEVLVLYATQETQTRIVDISPNPVMAGRPARIRIRVEADNGLRIGGIAMPSIAGGLACQATISNGEGNCSLTINATGAFSVRAEYLGAVGFLPSTAAAPLPVLTVIPFVDAIFRNGFD